MHKLGMTQQDDTSAPHAHHGGVQIAAPLQELRAHTQSLGPYAARRDEAHSSARLSLTGRKLGNYWYAVVW